MPTYPNSVDFSTFQRSEPFVLGNQTFFGGAADLDPSFTLVSGPRAVLEHIARRLISTPGSYDDPSYGFDVNTYLNASLLPQELDALEAAVRGEAEQVEGVDVVDVRVTLDAVRGLLAEITVTLVDQTESFDMVFVLGPDTIPRVYFPEAASVSA